jgi:hypothetical protein
LHIKSQVEGAGAAYIIFYVYGYMSPRPVNVKKRHFFRGGNGRDDDHLCGTEKEARKKKMPSLY